MLIKYYDSLNELAHMCTMVTLPSPQYNTQDTKTFPNVMLVGMASKISKTTHTSVWIAQDIRLIKESRVPRLNVHTNQILGHTFSRGTLDSVVS